MNGSVGCSSSKSAHHNTSGLGPRQPAPDQPARDDLDQPKPVSYTSPKISRSPYSSHSSCPPNTYTAHNVDDIHTLLGARLGPLTKRHGPTRSTYTIMPG
jgi:hypothetical protein